MLIICSNCFEETEDRKLFCSSCGEEVRREDDGVEVDVFDDEDLEDDNSS